MQLPTSVRERKRALRLLALAGLLTLPLAACSSPVDRVVASSPIPADYHVRHNIVLADAPRRLDIFFVGADGRLDFGQGREIEAFARDYLRDGQSGVRIAMPRGPVNSYAAERTLAAVRRLLLRNGVRSGVSIESYPVADPAIASPLHLSYVTLQARPTTRCGDWPDDLGSGSTLNTWENRTYYNFGCANQQTLAAQVADPRDLVKPRAEDPTDVQLRTRAIGQLRNGNDPSTIFSNNPPLIGTVGGF